jgi:hypothetical protein
VKDRVYTLNVTSSKPFRFDVRIADLEPGGLLVEGSAQDSAHSFSRGYAGLYQGSSGSSVPKVIF